MALDLSNNAGLGFAAAKLLLPMIKAHRHIIGGACCLGLGSVVGQMVS